jgi:hypothetical protein
MTMTRQKDLKRLVRTRMKKTGESYTAARAQLTRKKHRTAARPVPENRYAELAGMGDEAVRAKTGKTWKQWVRALDVVDAAEMPHRDIARHVGGTYDLSGWWAQTVTVGYERIRGLRDVGQRRGGAYEANKSRTLPVPIGRLYRAFTDARTRRRWLPGVELEFRKETPEKSLRIAWPDGTRVHASFTAKGDAKSQVAIQHAGLATRADATKRKAYWQERLDALGELIAPAGR